CSSAFKWSFEFCCCGIFFAFSSFASLLILLLSSSSSSTLLISFDSISLLSFFKFLFSSCSFLRSSFNFSIRNFFVFSCFWWLASIFLCLLTSSSISAFSLQIFSTFAFVSFFEALMLSSVVCSSFCEVATEIALSESCMTSCTCLISCLFCSLNVSSSNSRSCSKFLRNNTSSWCVFRSMLFSFINIVSVLSSFSLLTSASLIFMSF
ncbi:unnamed protein product, partial [Oikopleura dioica]